MTKFQSSASAEGFIGVEKEDEGSSRDVHVFTGPCGISMSKSEAYKVMLEIAKVAGLKTEPTGAGTGIIIQEPANPAIKVRKAELASRFFDKTYDQLRYRENDIIDYIIQGEIERGELK